MRSIRFVFISIFLVFIASMGQGRTLLEKGGTLPDFVLPFPEDLNHVNYLGLEIKKDEFELNDIKAKIVIIEIFSMYCPFCQKEAPMVNQLYDAVKNRTDIKLIGIGVGNSQFEVDHFKTTYDISFPLFPDPDFNLHKLFGEVRTPFFIVVDKSKSGSPEILYSRLGGFESVSWFLKEAGL